VKAGRLSALALGLMVAASALGQDAAPTTAAVALEATILTEGYSPAVSVSGRALAGVMLDPEGHPNAGERRQRLYTWLPAGVETEGLRLCISLTSRDGRYAGLLTAPLDAPVAAGRDARPLSVSFETRRPEYYTQYRDTPPPHRLAVLMELKASCDPALQAHRILPASWTPAQAPGVLHVMVNSSRMRTLLAVPVQRAGEPGRPRQLGVECDEIDAAQRIAFDTVCRLDLAELAHEGTPDMSQAQLVRMRGPSPARPVPVPLAP